VTLATRPRKYASRSSRPGKRPEGWEGERKHRCICNADCCGSPLTVTAERLQLDMWVPPAEIRAAANWWGW
jgi:hypothetical protein